jgi:hypothetical protein
MIKRMIKAHPTENRMARRATLVVGHPTPISGVWLGGASLAAVCSVLGLVGLVGPVGEPLAALLRL